SLFGSPVQAAAAVLLLVGATAGTLWWLDEEGGDAAQPATTAGLTVPALGSSGLAAAGPANGPTDDGDLPLSTGAAELLTPAQPPFLTGRLASAAGLPWADAEIVVSGVALDDWELLRAGSRDEIDERWQRRVTRSDAQGFYQVSGLPPGAWVVSASATESRPFTVGALVLVDAPLAARSMTSVTIAMRCSDAGRQAPDILTLDGTGTLELPLLVPHTTTRTIRLRDEAGRPLDGVELTALSVDAQLVLDAAPSHDWAYARLQSSLAAVRTDAQGLATVACSPGDLLVAVRRGWQTVRHQFVDAGASAAPIDITLTNTLSTTVSGQVIDEQGLPVTGALVWLSSYAVPVLSRDIARQTIAEQGLTSVLSNAAGRFTLGPVDRLSSSAWDPRCVTSAAPYLAVAAITEGTLGTTKAVQAKAARSLHEVTLTLRAGGPLDVEVIDQAMLLPAEGVTIEVVTSERQMFSGKLDEAGVWHHGGLPRGAVEITLQRPRCEPVIKTIDDWQGEALELLVHFQPVSWPLAVDVRDLAGQSVGWRLPATWSSDDDDHGAGVWLAAFDRDPAAVLAVDGAPWGALSGKRTDFRREGELFTIDFDESWTEDQAWIVLFVHGRPVSTERVARSTRQLEMVADVAALVSGSSFLTVSAHQRDSGDPIMGGDGRLYRRGSPHVAAQLTFAMDFQEGTSGLEGVVLEPGFYDLLVDPWIGAEVVIEGLQLSAGMAREVETSIGPGATLQATVSGATGKARYWLHDDATRLRSSGTIDLANGLDLSQLGDGRQLLTVLCSDGSASSWVTLVQGEQTRVTLALQPTAKVALSADAGWLEDFRQACLVVQNGQGHRLIQEVLLPTDADALARGAYEIDLPPGNHEVTLSAPGQTTLSGTVTCEPGEGQTLLLTQSTPR
ncbi:MAG: hypothetical protein ACI9EF_002940, partial [Pseudohongiellaceae bacterium]